MSEPLVTVVVCIPQQHGAHCVSYDVPAAPAVGDVVELRGWGQRVVEDVRDVVGDGGPYVLVRVSPW